MLLVGGAELVVRGASSLATSVGISPLVIGLTVVAFGTSAPELAVSVSASTAGNPGVAMGNVVGSNIFNVLVVLGVSALLAPLVVSVQLIRIEVPLMIAFSLALLLLALDGSISAADGGALLGVGLAYTGWTVWQSRRLGRIKDGATAAEPVAGGGRRGLVLAAGGVLVGLGLLVYGSDLFVTAAIDAAESFGVSDLVIGLTLVAAGTSMPELATSVLAGLRGQRDIAVGNAIGSNLFNIVWVLGLSAVFAEGGLDVTRSALRVDIPVMIAVAVACLPIFFTGRLIARWEGLLFIVMYAGYVLYLFLDATERGTIGPVPVVTLGFVLPLVLLTLGFLALRAWRGEQRSPTNP